MDEKFRPEICWWWVFRSSRLPTVVVISIQSPVESFSLSTLTPSLLISTVEDGNEKSYLRSVYSVETHDRLLRHLSGSTGSLNSLRKTTPLCHRLLFIWTLVTGTDTSDPNQYDLEYTLFRRTGKGVRLITSKRPRNPFWNRCVNGSTSSTVRHSQEPQKVFTPSFSFSQLLI